MTEYPLPVVQGIWEFEEDAAAVAAYIKRDDRRERMKLENIDISEFINEDHIRLIIGEAVEKELEERVSQYVREAVREHVDTVLHGELLTTHREVLKDELKRVLEDMNFFSVFRSASVRWNELESPSYTFLHRTVVDELGGHVRAQARRVIREMDSYDVSSMVSEVIGEAVKKGFGVEEEDSGAF